MLRPDPASGHERSYRGLGGQGCTPFSGDSDYWPWLWNTF